MLHRTHRTSAAALLALMGPAAGLADSPVRESLVVTASRTAQSPLDNAGNIAELSQDEIRLANPVHPYELGVRVPGVWIGRGSGQEHLTAIRSPVLTGPGSCGAFLVLEDNIPTRPAGFCNVNQLFEVPTVLARSVEVVRGPSNAYYGSNGLHGTVNTLLPEPGVDRYSGVSLETGSHDYLRGQFLWDSGADDAAWNAGLVVDRDGGYRDTSGFNQAKLFSKHRRDTTAGQLTLGLSASWLDQETAGFITGEDAYKQPDRFRNENPEAFRDAYSVRLSAGWTPNPGTTWAPEYRVYARHSDMEFLQHFLPGQPLEKNGQTSVGATALTRTEIGAASLTLGADTELATGFLDQFQSEPTSTGNPFVDNPRPQGQQYDYDVNSAMAAGFAALTVPFLDNWELQAGLRGEYVYYDYTNNMLAGNTDANGNPCPEPTPGGAGCLYARPASRTDSFFNTAFNAGLLYRFSDATVGFVNYAQGFRVPQATELYRLQRTQTVADINSEQLDSVEVGTRHIGDTVTIEAVAFLMYKDNFIFRDSAGFNVSDGETRHYGIEANVDWRLTDRWYLSLVGSLAEQTYRFDRNAGLGEVIVKGNDVDTAPQILASARLGYNYDVGYIAGLIEMEGVHNDPYFLDAANTERYEGHDILNLRATANLSPRWSVAVRVTNLTDVKYADRADLFSPTNEFRYFPGRDREYYLQLNWRADD